MSVRWRMQTNSFECIEKCKQPQEIKKPRYLERVFKPNRVEVDCSKQE